MFCVECGKECGEALSESGLCHVCFLAKNTFATVPPNVDFEVCVHCRARKRGEVWVPPHVTGGGERFEPLVAGAVEESVRVDPRVTGAAVRVHAAPEDAHERNFDVTVHVSGVAEDVPFTEELSTRGRIKNATCLRCSRIMGGYWEGIVQLRADRRDLAEDELREARAVASRVIDRIVETGDYNAFVLKDEEIHGGLDVYTGTINAGRMIARAFAQAFGTRISEHAKIVGRKDGVDMHRVTFALRVPAYRQGDVLIVDDAPFVVTTLTPKIVTLRPLPHGTSRTLEHHAVQHAPVLAREEAKDAVVVSRQDSEMQVLDPWSFQTVSVLRPPDVPADADTVRIIRWEETPYVLP